MGERNWGVFTGKPWSEVEKILQPMTLEERYQYIPQGGESWKIFEKRLIKTIQKITQDNHGKTIVIVTHGGAIRALMPFLLSVRREESFKYDPDNASLTIFDFDEKGFYKV
jgi:broad specificity phosphatase PhoE